MIKSKLITACLLLFFVSCQNNEIAILKKKVETLGKKNSILKDSIEKNRRNYIRKGWLIGIPEQCNYKVNKKGKIMFGFWRKEKLPEYNFYIKLSNTGEKKYLVKNSTEPTYTYEFTPKSLDDNKVEVWVESVIDKDTIGMGTTMHYGVIE